MRSTDPDHLSSVHPKLKHFFDRELMPLAAEMKLKQDIIPWVSIDNDTESYYHVRKVRSMSKQDFEIIGSVTLESFAEDLRAYWNNNEDSELPVLLNSLAAIAEEFYVIEDQSEEIPPNVYVMF